MRRKDFDELIDKCSFRELFVTEMGWNNPSNHQPIYITLGDQDYDFCPVAEKCGFQVYTCELPQIPTAADCKKVDNKLRNYGYDYICIFIQESTSHHLWFTPVKINEKRELVKTEYLNGNQADFLFSKVDDLSFGITEEVFISDVKERVHGSFQLNSEKITKDFFREFKQEHERFFGFITGIDDHIREDGKGKKKNRKKDWYASVMLNRLMFCYFVQKKGFLDGDVNYLHNKLKRYLADKETGTFFQSFYRGFLCALFHDGLNSPRQNKDFKDKYGCIPYLNGGMFDEHELEKEFTDIDIDDQAFEELFSFFDKWEWHLDTRLTASGKDINPDVLGYIFEQYINDRSAMGAYYTKEDITEYIGKNCILPFLMDKTEEKSPAAFKPDGFVWKLLRESGRQYIYDAVQKGYSDDWEQKIPDYIQQGIALLPEQHNLLERRARWNEKTWDEFALPTEIWRETIKRLQRCDSLQRKIRGGEINHINDFITYNLDIRRFVEDVLRKTDDHLFVLHFYEALQNVTILDPTCGSGAFLFASMNILEPLYEACIDRMEEFHKENPKLFVDQLNEIEAKYSSNRQYFIFKSIILRNLYGVDIMVEATEIAKLRLFLKMVAVVEVDRRKDNMGLDPLPDIDFNIKCGNTLVGYATEKELDETLSYGDMFAKLDFKEKIDDKMKQVASAYNLFRNEQLKVNDDNASIKETKTELKARLADLNRLLNEHMYKSITGKDVLTDEVDLWYAGWEKSHQPFHWLAEFYQIIHGNGGFDVIVGNPPYVEYKKKDSKTHKAVSDYYSIKGYTTEECGNLYAYVIERCYNLCTDDSSSGYIIPSASLCTPRMNILAQLFKTKGSLWSSIWDERPSKLFDGVDQQLCIHLSRVCKEKVFFITKMNHWITECRTYLFRCINYQNYDLKDSVAEVTPKIQEYIERKILTRLKERGTALSAYSYKTGEAIYYKNAGGRYWRLIKSFPTYFKSSTRDNTTTEKVFYTSKDLKKILIASLASNTFYWYWRVASNCRHLTDREMSAFPIANTLIKNSKSVNDLCDTYERSLIKNKRTTTTFNKTSGEISQDFYYMKLSKPIIDEIDKVLAKHYGFTEEELDFIINYDIKYRMGDELNEEN